MSFEYLRDLRTAEDPNYAGVAGLLMGKRKTQICPQEEGNSECVSRREHRAPGHSCGGRPAKDQCGFNLLRNPRLPILKARASRLLWQNISLRDYSVSIFSEAKLGCIRPTAKMV